MPWRNMRGSIRKPPQRLPICALAEAARRSPHRRFRAECSAPALAIRRACPAKAETGAAANSPRFLRNLFAKLGTYRAKFLGGVALPWSHSLPLAKHTVKEILCHWKMHDPAVRRILCLWQNRVRQPAVPGC